MNTKKLIAEFIANEMNNYDIITIWNLYADQNNYSDSIVYGNDDDFLDDNFSSIAKAVHAVCYGDYNCNDDYVCFNGYGNLDSFDTWDDSNSPIDIDCVAEYLMENGDCGGVSIDSDNLCQAFCDAFATEHNVNVNDVENAVNAYLDDEDFDFLTEDWTDLESTISEKMEKGE